MYRKADMQRANHQLEEAGMDTVSSNTVTEAGLAKRFSKEYHDVAEMLYEVTTDIGYLHQYYLLRDQLFIGSANAGKAQEEGLDVLSDIMVARSGNHCVAGTRLTLRDASSLPSQVKDKGAVMELSRFAILPEYENSTVLLELLRNICNHAKSQADTLVAYMPMKQAQQMQRAMKLFGIAWAINKDVTSGQDMLDGSPMVLCMTSLNQLAAPKTPRNRKADQLKPELAH